MRFASFDISSTPEDQYQTFGARTDVLALRMTLSQLPQQDLIGYDTATAQIRVSYVICYQDMSILLFPLKTMHITENIKSEQFQLPIFIQV